MDTVADSIAAAQASEHQDIGNLAGLVTQLLAAFASGAITPAQAQAITDQINADDATAKGAIAAIQAVLNPPAPTPAPVPPAA